MENKNPTKEITVDGIGTFVFHLPTLKDQLRIGIMKTRDLCQGVNPEALDSMTDNISHMVATLAVCCDSYPTDGEGNSRPFDFLSLDDFEALLKIYKPFDTWRLRFRDEGGVPTPQE